MPYVFQIIVWVLIGIAWTIIGGGVPIYMFWLAIAMIVADAILLWISNEGR